MNARYILLADDAYIDEVAKLYADGIFEEIVVEKFPALHKRLVIAVRFEGTKDEIGAHNCKIIFSDRLNKVIATGIVEFQLGGKGPIFRAGIISTIRKIPLKGPGTYGFSILVDDRFITSVAFTVRIQQITPENPSAIA